MVALRRARGFTLPELLAGVAVMAILAAVAAPSFSELIATQRVKGAASDVFATLLRTRSEAIKRNTAITLSPAADGWQSGWSIAHPTDDDILLDDHGAVTGATIDGPDGVTYLPNGRISGTAAPTFDIEVEGSSQHRCVEIDLSGRPYQKPTACDPAP